MLIDLAELLLLACLAMAALAVVQGCVWVMEAIA